MTCVTCDGTQALPPTHSLSPDNPGYALGLSGKRADIHAHTSARFGDVIAPGALAVLWRGMDMTAQCVEAFAGPEGVGWVEIRTMPEPGRYTLHAARHRCPHCGLHDPQDQDHDGACPQCGDDTPPVVDRPAHTQTTIRYGATVIVRGVELITHPARRPDQIRTVDPVAPTGDDVIRDKIQAMVDAGVIGEGAGLPGAERKPIDPDVWGSDVDITDHVTHAEVAPGREPIEMADAERDHINAVADQLRQLGWTIEPPPACTCVITDGAETYTTLTCPIHGTPIGEADA